MDTTEDGDLSSVPLMAAYREEQEYTQISQLGRQYVHSL